MRHVWPRPHNFLSASASLFPGLINIPGSDRYSSTSQHTYWHWVVRTGHASSVEFVRAAVSRWVHCPPGSHWPRHRRAGVQHHRRSTSRRRHQHRSRRRHVHVPRPWRGQSLWFTSVVSVARAMHDITVSIEVRSAAVNKPVGDWVCGI